MLLLYKFLVYKGVIKLDVNVTITGKQLIPSVFNVKQGSNLSDRLNLKFDSYLSESGVDLSKCTCTVVCELMASKPMPFEIIKLNPVKKSDGTMTALWRIDNRITCYYGNVLFEIVFKDGNGNVTWVSHTATLIVGKSSSNTADEDTVARYPSILEMIIEQTSQGGIDDFNIVTTGSGPFVKNVIKQGDTVTVNKSNYQTVKLGSGAYITDLMVSEDTIVQIKDSPNKLTGTFSVTCTSSGSPSIFEGSVNLRQYLNGKLILLNIYDNSGSLFKQAYTLSDFNEQGVSGRVECNGGVIDITAYASTNTQYRGTWRYEILYIE